MSFLEVMRDVLQERALDAEGVLVESAICRNAVYWESPEGHLLGPARMTHVAKETMENGQVRFWLCVEYGGSWCWIHESRLRSRATYDRARRKDAYDRTD